MKHDDLFEHLEPRPFGLTRLRARLDAPPRRRPVRLYLAAGAALAALLLLLFVPPRGPDLRAAARAHGGGAEIELGLLPMPVAALALTPAQRPTAALAEVPTKNPNVSFYWVSSTTWSD